MAEQQLQQLKKDHKVMVKVLCEHGLLMELSEEVLNSNVKMSWATLSKQITKLNTPPTYRDRAQTAVKYIRRLGSIPDGRLRAIKHLLEVSDRYCEENGEYNCQSDVYHKGDEELAPMKQLMCDLIREHYMACQVSKVDWAPFELMDEIDELQEERYACEVDFGSCDMRDREDLFIDAVDLLELVCERRAATMLANKVAGHVLPPELVNMIRDCICSDENLRAGG